MCVCGQAWTESENATLADAHRQFGNQWSRVARLLQGRTENTVKNHWNATLRRKQPARLPGGGISALDVYMVVAGLKSYDPVGDTHTHTHLSGHARTLRLHEYGAGKPGTRAKMLCVCVCVCRRPTQRSGLSTPTRKQPTPPHTANTPHTKTFPFLSPHTQTPHTSRTQTVGATRLRQTPLSCCALSACNPYLWPSQQARPRAHNTPTTQR